VETMKIKLPWMRAARSIVMPFTEYSLWKLRSPVFCEKELTDDQLTHIAADPITGYAFRAAMHDILTEEQKQAFITVANMMKDRLEPMQISTCESFGGPLGEGNLFEGYDPIESNKEFRRQVGHRGIVR
jgi:hypothetical protein